MRATTAMTTTTRSTTAAMATSRAPTSSLCRRPGASRKSPAIIITNTTRRRAAGPSPVALAPLGGRPSTASSPRRPLQDRVVVVASPPRAAAEPSSSSEEAKGLGKTAVLGFMFGAWYFFNIFFNIYNKQVLKAFRFPVTCTELQFVVGSCLAAFVWVTGIHKRPKLTKDQILTILPLACVHTLGNLLTNVALGKVAVSFTHTIKAMEPFFSVALSSAFLGDAPSLPILLSLVPIVGGVALASATEASFNWAGFGAAMGSNLTFQSRNVLSKKFMGGKAPLDNINLFSVITIMSALILLPFALFFEGFQIAPAKITAMGLDYKFIMSRAVFAAVCFHSYQQVSYMILQRVSPVTHSIGNCVKRVVVIVSSVIVFQTPVNVLNAVGTAVALSGVFLYSQVKRLGGKKK